jgi:hypothetical protein
MNSDQLPVERPDGPIKIRGALSEYTELPDTADERDTYMIVRHATFAFWQDGRWAQMPQDLEYRAHARVILPRLNAIEARLTAIENLLGIGATRAQTPDVVDLIDDLIGDGIDVDPSAG